MKKLALVLAIMFVAASVALPAWARGPYGGASPAAANVTPEQRAQFLKETELIRKSIWEKQTQLDALIAKSDSDPAQIGTLEKELYSLREELRTKAQAYGMPCGMGGPGWCGGRGRMGGRGGCWAAGQ